MSALRRVQGAALRRSGFVKPEVVVFDVTHACTSRCTGCAFREAEVGELSVARWGELALEARDLGFSEIVLTGGEPLAHSEIGELLPSLAAHLPVSLMTNGLALAKHASLVREHASRVFVSFDAMDGETYQRIRGVRGLPAVEAGVRELSGRYLHARTTVWAENIAQIPAIIERAREIGFTEMSLLACDLTSAGFGERGEERGRRPTPEQVAKLQTDVVRFRTDPFVAMSSFAMDRLLSLLGGRTEPPPCLAPWTSGVVDPTGHWRHCFFLPSRANASAGLRAAMRSARADRRSLDVGANPTCASCVCWRA